MAETSTVPLWFSALTFVGGALSGQATEYFRSRREADSRKMTRSHAQLDRRIEFQRSTLIAMQESALIAIQRFIHIVQNGYLPIQYRTDPKLLGQILDKQRRFLWRWSLLRSRVTDADIRDRAVAFESALSTIFVGFTAEQADKLLDETNDRFNELNHIIGIVLRKLDSEEVTT